MMGHKTTATFLQVKRSSSPTYYTEVGECAVSVRIIDALNMKEYNVYLTKTKLKGLLNVLLRLKENERRTCNGPEDYE